MRKIETIEREWSLTLKEIENIAQRIASEGINPSLLESARSVTTHCEKIARMAGPLLVEGGSFIPGPIGIVCSLALAIADFAVGNFFGGFMNLLCCVPFAKAGCKVLLPTLKKIVADILKNPMSRPQSSLGITILFKVLKTPADNRKGKTRGKTYL